MSNKEFSQCIAVEVGDELTQADIMQQEHTQSIQQQLTATAQHIIERAQAL